MTRNKLNALCLVALLATFIWWMESGYRPVPVDEWTFSPSDNIIWVLGGDTVSVTLEHYGPLGDTLKPYFDTGEIRSMTYPQTSMIFHTRDSLIILRGN